MSAVLGNLCCLCMQTFLQYGLSLQEREEFGFEASDMGYIMQYWKTLHAVTDMVENFAGKLKESVEA